VSRDPYRIGARVFLRIFELAPEARKLFRFDGMSEMELIVNGLFRIHASRFIRAIDLAVNNLDAFYRLPYFYIFCSSIHALPVLLRFLTLETKEPGL